MAYNDSQHSNETARSHCDSEEDSMDKCDTALDASQESNLSRRGSDIRNHLTRSPFEDPRRNSSPHESYIQDIPLDFSMPKRKGFDSLSNSPKHEVHSPFLTSSPPPHLLISGRNSSGMYNESARTNGCVSPADMPPECRLQSPCDNKPPEAMPNPLLNGQFIEAGAIPTEFYLRERSHSLSSSLQKQRQRGGGIPQGSPRGVWRGGGPIRSHHGNDPTLISALAANAVGYPELISPHPPGCASPILGSVQSEELLSVQMYKDHMQQLGVDNHHYTFLPSTIPSCVTDSVSRNSIISSLPNMLPPSIPSPTGRHPTPTATATASTNSISSSITPPSPSSISSTSSSCTITTPAKRRPRSLPDNQKDDAYWERRRKNNEAAKRSRDARRLKEEEIALRASFLEQENVKLKCEVASLKTETAKLKCLLFNN